MKKRTLSILTAIIAVSALLAGCGGGGSSAAKAESNAYYDDGLGYAAAEAYDYSDDVYEYEEPVEEEASADYKAAGSDSDVATDEEIQSNSNRKLIKTVNLTAETREFDSLIANVTDRIESLGGYAQSTEIHGNSYGSQGERSAFIVARIPAQKLDSFVQGITEQSNITSKNESAEDVTLQYADVEAHKESLKIEQERLNQLLEQADNLENIIELENRLTQVRYEIESYESRLRTMNNQVVYATVNLNVHEVREYTPEPVIEPTFGERIAAGFIESCENAWELIQDFIVGFVSILPTLLVVLVILAVIFLIIFGIIRLIISIARKSAKNRPPKSGNQPKGKKVVATAVSTPPAAKPEEAGKAPAAEENKEN